MGEDQPASVGAQRRRAGADFVVGEREVLNGQQQVRVAPVHEVGAFADPDVELVSAAAVYGHGALKAHVHAVDPLGEQHHVAVVRHAQGNHFIVMQVVGFRNAAAHAMTGVHREGHVNLPFDVGQARVVGADDFLVLQREHGLGLDLPVNAVVTEREADIRAGKFRLADVLIVVAERHRVATLIADYAGVEHERAGIGNVLTGHHGVAFITVNAGMRKKLGIRHKYPPFRCCSKNLRERLHYTPRDFGRQGKTFLDERN